MDRAAAVGPTPAGKGNASTGKVVALASALACLRCPARELTLCDGLDAACVPVDSTSSDDPFHHAAARSAILHQKEAADSAAVICSGWAISAVALPDGRRQIVSMLLPGDPFPPVALFGSECGRSVEAATNVIYRKFKLSDLKSLAYQKPQLFFKMSRLFAQERDASDQLLLDLGRRNPEERIARLILRLRDRLLLRGLADRAQMDFPLRLRDIADATGLTAAHVRRVMKKFVRLNLVKAGGRSLVLLDLAALMQIAKDAGAVSGRAL